MDLYAFDEEIRKEYKVICGVDEAGRGPLAGDVYAAAVILDENNIIDGINDSKKLSKKRREALFEEIISKSKAYSIGIATVEEIEKYNILQATFLAMRRAVEPLNQYIDLALIDGNSNPKLNVNTKTIVKGDATSASIAAASILAKVSRDRYMDELHEKYPEYCFNQHSGYGTKLHIQKILEFGACEVHRESFLKKIYAKHSK